MTLQATNEEEEAKQVSVMLQNPLKYLASQWPMWAVSIILRARDL